jgi:hemolysin III
MGWMAVIATKPIVAVVPTGALCLLVAGGLAYTAGTVFYARDEKVKYFHAVWHLFVILGSVLHFCAVVFYLVPPT